MMAAVLAFVGVGGYPVMANAESIEYISVETTAEIGEETDESVSVDNSNEENKNTAENVEITLDNILDFAGELADKSGVGDDWDKAVENLKNAADAKKVDIMTGVSVAQIVLLASYIIGKLIHAGWKKHKDTTADDVKEMKKTTGKQTKAVNELIGHTETVANNVAEASERERKLADAGLEQNAALRCLFRGVQLKQDIKEEALRHLNNSDKCYDEAKS
jgi:lipopolysaccharide biosynthesis regulator YciM